MEKPWQLGLKTQVLGACRGPKTADVLHLPSAAHDAMAAAPPLLGRAGQADRSSRWGGRRCWAPKLFERALWIVGFYGFHILRSHPGHPVNHNPGCWVAKDTRFFGGEKPLFFMGFTGVPGRIRIW